MYFKQCVQKQWELKKKPFQITEAHQNFFSCSDRTSYRKKFLLVFWQLLYWCYYWWCQTKRSMGKTCMEKVLASKSSSPCMVLPCLSASLTWIQTNERQAWRSQKLKLKSHREYRTVCHCDPQSYSQSSMCFIWCISAFEVLNLAICFLSVPGITNTRVRGGGGWKSKLNWHCLPSLLFRTAFTSYACFGIPSNKLRTV